MDEESQRLASSISVQIELMMRGSRTRHPLIKDNLNSSAPPCWLIKPQPMAVLTGCLSDLSALCGYPFRLSATAIRGPLA